jgi:hypothetical protein
MLAPSGERAVINWKLILSTRDVCSACRWANHLHRVLKRFIERKVPRGTPDVVMAQTVTGKKKRCMFRNDSSYR